MRPEEADAARKGLAHLQTAAIGSGGQRAIIWLEEWCEDCGHVGVVENVVWLECRAAYAAKFGDAEVLDRSDHEHRTQWEDAWWAERGLSYADGTVPPEEVPCAKCEGHGRKVTRDGLALYAFVARWWSP